MSRALLALTLFVARAAFAAAPPRPKTKGPHDALAAAACAPNSPPLLVQQPPDRMSACDGGCQTPPIALPQGQDCVQTVTALSPDTRIALSPASPGSAAPSEEQRQAAFERRFATVGDLSAALDSVARQHGLDLDVASGRATFDNGAGGGDAQAALVAALKQELKPPTATNDRKDYPGPGPRTVPTSEVPPLPEYEGVKDPPRTLSDIPLIGRAVNHFLPQYSDAPLIPWHGAASPPPALETGPVNPNGIPAASAGQPTSTNPKSINGADIWAPFMAKLQACRPDCQPQEFGIWRAGYGSSCHNVGRAIDLHSIRCGDGKVYRAIDSGATSGPFYDLVTCMRSDKGGSHLFAIWHQCFLRCTPGDKTSYHMDHTHLSIGCDMSGHRMK